MKKTLSFVLAVCLLAGCSSATSASKASSSASEAKATAETVEVEGLNIISPSGAPSYSLVPVLKEGKNTVTVTDGPDALQAAFVNPEPEYDVIVAPTNLGCKLAAAGKTTYKLAAIVTKGNLFIVSSEDNVPETEGKELAVFGEQAVPGMVFNKLFPEVKANVTWYASVTEAQAALLSGQADAALLAEPAVTATIAKAKENGKDLKVTANLQDMWGENGYPMAGLFIEEKSLTENKALYQSMIQEMSDYTAGVNDGSIDVAADLDALTDVELSSVPSKVIAKAYTGMGVECVKAAEDIDNLNSFLELFGVKIDETSIANLD